MKPYFIWNDIDSRSLGVWVSKLPDIIRPNERVTSVQIYGRSGTLHTVEGSNVYDAYNKTVSIIVRPEADVGTILNTYRGAGKVIFSNEPNRVYTAYIADALQLKRDGTWLMTGDLTFEVQPFKTDTARPSAVTVTSGSTVLNIGDVELYPLITVAGSGGNVMTITVNGEIMKIDTTLESNPTYVLDCLNETCVRDFGTRVENRNMYMSGNYPQFNVGENIITFSNVTSFSFVPDWLYL